MAQARPSPPHLTVTPGGWRGGRRLRSGGRVTNNHTDNNIDNNTANITDNNIANYTNKVTVEFLKISARPGFPSPQFRIKSKLRTNYPTGGEIVQKLYNTSYGTGNNTDNNTLTVY